METKEKKDQFIIAYIPDLNNTEGILNNAIHIASQLNKGLILLHISDKSYNNIETAQAEEILKGLNNEIKGLSFHSYCAIEGNTKDILHNITALLSGVLLVTAVNKSYSKQEEKKKADSPKALLNNLYSSRIAYLIIPQTQKSTISFNSIIITINNMRESKEKVLWASYFGRFFKSSIIVFYHNYKDEYYRHQLHYNIKFIMRMFDNFKLKYQLYLSSNRKTFVDYQAISFGKENNIGLVICQTTKNKDFFNKLFGIKEKNTIQNKENMPILFLNPRDDLFVLCD